MRRFKALDRARAVFVAFLERCRARRAVALSIIRPVSPGSSCSRPSPNSPRRGGVGRYNELIATPVIGPLLAYTITLLLGYFVAEAGARNVFLAADDARRFQVNPRRRCQAQSRAEFIANAQRIWRTPEGSGRRAQAARYGEISGSGRHGHRRRA
ncbi:hypothetical protein ACU4GH_22835 [Bradyrhizobium betae]